MSSWTDKKAVETTLKLRDEFQIKEFIETGTYKGVNINFYADKFEQLKSCDIYERYLGEALETVKGKTNIVLYSRSSPDFLKEFVKRYKKEKREDIVFIYLDAHFYNKNVSKEDRFVVIKELKALKGFDKCIISIHDFDNGELGHIVYDNQHLNLDLIKKDLMKVNKNFKLYTNTRKECDIVTKEEIKLNSIKGLYFNDEMDKTLDFVWSNPIKTYRGILYAISTELDLTKYKLKKL